MAGIAYLSPIRWSRAVSTPGRSSRRGVGWPISRQAGGLAASISELVKILMASSWGWVSRCASSMTRSGRRPRSPCSAAMREAAWAASSAEPWAGFPPSALTTWWWMPLVPVVGSGVKERVPGLVEGGGGGAGGHRLADADLARYDTGGALAGAPGDAGGGLGVGGVAAEHGRGEVLAERGAGEPVVVFQVDHVSPPWR